jgi:acyl-CoA reductase-like NAD-dependent aldehyde dehydrogenase
VGALCESNKVRGLSFTGSTRIGKMLLERCASTMKRVSLELGGHAPFIAFADCDIASAAKAAVDAKYQTSGQDCLAANRIYVDKRIEAEFVTHFVKEAAKLVPGDGFDPSSTMGPLINRQGVAKSAEHIADAVRKGARLELGTPLPSQETLFVNPTVLSGVTDDMLITHEETFGPVAAIIPFHDEDAVVKAANATDYGLAAYVFTQNLSRAMRVTDALEYGMVAINSVKFTGAPIPFGGIKHSGLGREGSRHGIEEYLETKYVCMGI